MLTAARGAALLLALLSQVALACEPDPNPALLIRRMFGAVPCAPARAGVEVSCHRLPQPFGALPDLERFRWPEGGVGVLRSDGVRITSLPYGRGVLARVETWTPAGEHLVTMFEDQLSLGSDLCPELPSPMFSDCRVVPSTYVDEVVVFTLRRSFFPFKAGVAYAFVNFWCGGYITEWK